MAAVLTWIKSKSTFLKIQEGSGDNLSREDIADGMKDYVLWSTFRPECIDIDEEMNMMLIDGGMMMFTEQTKVDVSIPACYEQAFDVPYDCNDVIILMHEEDCGRENRAGRAEAFDARRL